MQKLKDDFAFNLKLLEERDAELERYDASFTNLKALVRERDVELSELKISTAEMQHGLKQERDRAAEAEAYYQQKVAQLREEGEAVRWKKEDELRTARDEFESLKRDLTRQARDLQDTLERERREAAATFDAASQQREKEYTARVDELAERLRAAEGAAHASDTQLAESRSQQVSAVERAETLAAKMARVERAADEYKQEATRREARDAAKLEELEREKGSLMRGKQAEGAEYEGQVAELTHRLASLERFVAKQREGAELAAAQHQAEAQQAAARHEARLADVRAQLEEAEAAAQLAARRGAEARRAQEEAAHEGDEKAYQQRRQHEEALAAERARAAAADEAARAELDAAAQRAAEAEQQAEALRRQLGAARAELAAAHEATQASQARAAELKAAAHRAEDERDAAAAARHEELVGTLQAQRDEAHEKLREAQRRGEEVEAAESAARAELARKAAACDAAEARVAELLEVQMQMAQQQAELRMHGGGPHGGGGGEPPARRPPLQLGAASGLDDELPSPVSIPSLPLSPMHPKWGGASGAAAAAPSAAAAGPAAGGGAAGGAARVLELEAENGRLRAEVASLEEQAAKMREAVSAMRAEIVELGQASPRVAAAPDELRELEQKVEHYTQYNALLQARVEEQARGVDGGAAAEVRLLRGRVQALEANAARLRQQLKDAQLAAARAGASTAFGAAADGAGDAAILRQRDREVATLRAQLEQIRGGGASAAAGAGACASGGALVSQLQARLTQMTAQLGDKTRELEEMRVRQEGGGLLVQLQTKLAAAEADVTRLVAEREKLMEISNVLRADLHRVTAASVQPAAGGVSSAAVKERMEREVASRYEAKLGEIETSMRELVTQNGALKVELRKWTEHTEVEARNATGRLARGSAAESAGRAERISRLAAEETALLTQAAQPPRTADGASGTPAPAAAAAAAAARPHRRPQSARAAEPAGLGAGRGVLGGGGAERAASERSAEARRAALARLAEPLADEGDGDEGEPVCSEVDEPAELGGGGDASSSRWVLADPDGGGSAVRWAAPRGTREASGPGAEPSSARHRARAKLEEAKLSLSGSSAPRLTERPAAAGQSARSTSSQTKARLNEIQKKRAELVRKRQGVRNYNDVED